MEKELLFRFFAGETSERENETIMDWVKSSDKNMAELKTYRRLYDTVIFTKYHDNHRKRSLPVWQITKKVTAVAASVAVVAISSIALYEQMHIEPAELNTISVPSGQRANIVLADGTDVWLNAGSTMTYPSKFSKNSREVYLCGEAFFDVVHNEKKPFRVKTETFDIKVLGTQFNLDAYSGSGIFEASLMRGKIDVCQRGSDVPLVSLLPNQMSYLSNGKLVVRAIEDQDKYRWKDGLYCFKNEKFTDIMVDLERYYDVKIEVSEDRFGDYSLTGKFRVSDGLDYALRVLQESIGFKFERDKENNIYYIE